MRKVYNGVISFKFFFNVWSVFLTDIRFEHYSCLKILYFDIKLNSIIKDYCEISTITKRDKGIYISMFLCLFKATYNNFHLTRTENRTSPLNLPGKYKLKHQIRTT